MAGRIRIGSAVAAVVVLAAGCSSSASPTESTAPLPLPTEGTVSCELLPRFRLAGIEYTNRQFDDVVAEADLGPVVGEISVYPAALDRCESVVLQDGEGTLPAGTQIHEIAGIDPTIALTASMGNGVYLKYIGRPTASN